MLKQPNIGKTLALRAQSLFRDLARADADGSLRNLLARLARTGVLLVDDWPMAAPVGAGAP